MPLIRKPSAGESVEPPSGELSSPLADARWAAARRMQAPRDVAGLAAALEEETDARVREAIFTSLVRIGGPESAQALALQVRSDDASLRTGALDALRASPAAAAAVLPELLFDPDGDVRLLACELVRVTPGEASMKLLCEMLSRETEANVAGAGVEVLAEVGGPEVLPTLERCADRFADEAFLMFAIRIARDRIGAQQSG